MKDILMQYRSEFSNSCIFVVNKDNVKLYDDDSILLEYINNIESNKNTISFKFKYLEETLKLFRRKKINYIVIDSDINYQVYDYYFTEYNNYIRYLNFGKIFNRFKKKHIKVYSLPENKYEY